MTAQAVRCRRGAVKLNASHIAGYSLAATAGALSGTAQGAITYSGPINQLIQDTTLDTTAVGTDLLFGSTPFHLALLHSIGTTNASTGVAFSRPTAFGTPGVDVAGFQASGYNYVSNVASGAAISLLPTFLNAATDGTLAFNGGYGNDQFLAAGIGFVGVRFNTNQYGWVRLNFSGAPLNAFTVVDFAYGDAGEAIVAGQTESIPAPASLGMLALGAAGLRGMRRRSIAA